MACVQRRKNGLRAVTVSRSQATSSTSHPIIPVNRCNGVAFRNKIAQARHLAGASAPQINACAQSNTARKEKQSFSSGTVSVLYSHV